MRKLLRAGALSALSAMIVCLSACSHRVSINSNPAGARVYIDDEFQGLTPASFVERSGFGRKYSVRLEKDGYRPVETREKQHLNVLYLVLSIFTCGVGAFWSFSLEDRYDYALQPG
jgi:hypothetical protein